MKKLLLLTLAIVMTLTLVACGSDPAPAVPLVDVTTKQGVSLKLPSDMTLQESLAYGNTTTGDAASFGVTPIGDFPIANWTQEDVLTTYSTKNTDVVIKSFENGKVINGNKALVSSFTLKSPKGNALTGALVVVTDGTNNYVITFLYGSDNTSGSLATNMQACIDSIKIVGAK